MSETNDFEPHEENLSRRNHRSIALDIENTMYEMMQEDYPNYTHAFLLLQRAQLHATLALSAKEDREFH